MHAIKPKQSRPGGESPLAQSVFSGEARLRELEHLAETARKVRDQAAAELTRSGSTHHIARDRIAAAERMLRKTQQEITELRAQLGPASRPATPPQPSPQDFELAVLLGHSKARFNHGDAAQSPLQIQQDSNRPVAARGRPGVKRPITSTARHIAGPPKASLGRTLAFSILVACGVGVGAIGTYAVASTGSLADASQLVREQGQRLLARLRALMPISAATAEPATLQALAEKRMHAVPTSTRETQEAQARAAAEQRLARRLSGPAAQF